MHNNSAWAWQAASASARFPLTAWASLCRQGRLFRKYPIGYFHIDIAEMRTEEGKIYLLVAISWTSKLAFAELHEKATRAVAANFLKSLIAAVPYKIHTLLTDNGTRFTASVNVSMAQEIKEAPNFAKRLRTFEGSPLTNTSANAGQKIRMSSG